MEPLFFIEFLSVQMDNLFKTHPLFNLMFRLKL